MGEILVSQELLQVEYATIFPSVLVSQELLQVEYATRFPSVLVSQELLQVEYTIGPTGVENLESEIVGNYLIEPEYAYVQSTHRFDDFDVQVDFTICSGVDTTRCGVEICFKVDEDNGFFLRAGSYISNDVFMCEFKQNGVWSFYTTARINDYGKLRVSRSFGNLVVYYKDGSDSWFAWKSYSGFIEGKGNILLGLRSYGSFNSSATLDNFIVNYEKGCQTCYFYDQFYGNDGDLYNTSLWAGSTSNIEIRDNKLHIPYSNVHTYVDTKYTPIGDFNVQVDFGINNYWYLHTWSQRLGIYFENNDRFEIRYTFSSTYPYKKYEIISYVSGTWTTLAYYFTDITSGKFRITRKGNLFSSYFLQDNKWFHFIDWNMVADTNISHIRLDHACWDNNPSFECYFDNFVINDNFDVYTDVVIDGDYSHVNGNYIKLEGGNVRTNKIIQPTNAVTFEWSTAFEDYNSVYSFGFCISTVPFRTGCTDHSGESIYITYYNGAFRLYIDGYSYNYILDGDNLLFYPIYGQPYIIGIKFIPGTGTIIYWEGPTNGYLIIDYIMNGALYAWCGNHYGKGDYGTQVTRVHRFRCFEDKKTYKELINSWLQDVGANDGFNLSDDRGPNLDRWTVFGDPKIYSNCLKLISTNEDKIQSKTFFCAPFEIILDYNNLSFNYINGLALSLNMEAYDSYKDTIFGTSKFKVGYSGGVAAWVNYYCSGSSGNSSIYYISDVSNRKLKIINNGYSIQYLLSDGDNWITILSQDCARQYYYKISVEGTNPNVVAYLDSIVIDSEEFITPTDAVALIPTAWKFSPTDKAYQDSIYVPLNELINRCRHFYVDSVVKIDNSMFLSYIECDKDLVEFSGAIVVGDNYSSLISAIEASSNGEVIYVLPGTYPLGGYTFNKKIIIVGVGDYRTINIVISGSSVKLDNAVVIFKNINMIEQLPSNSITFRTQGSGTSYFTMDNCKYTSSNNNIELFKIEGTAGFYVYMRKSYINHNGYFAYTESGYPDIYFDIFNCRILRVPSNICPASNGYQMRSMIYSNSSIYEPVVTDSIPIVMLFSPNNDTNIYLNTPKGLEKTVTSKENEFNYLSFGNGLGGVIFFGGDNDYYSSEYLVSPVDDSFKLVMQGYIDTVRVFDTYPNYSDSINNINIINNLGINLKLAHNNTVVDYKIYEPINQYNSSLVIGRNTSSVVDEFIWSKTATDSLSLLGYYNDYLTKLGYLDCNIVDENVEYKFFIDLDSTAGVGSLVQTYAHNFSNVEYYSDNVSDPSLLSTTCSLSNARWYVLYNNISYNASSLTPGVFSIFPTVSGYDASMWSYTGESGYIDNISNSSLNATSSLNSVYNIEWKRDKKDINDYMVSSFNESITIDLKLFGGGICNKIIIKSGYKIGTEYVGYITKCSIAIDGVIRFSIDNNINSIITALFDSIAFTTIELIVYEVKQVPDFYFNSVHLSGNVLFVNYVKVLSTSLSKKFDTTLCNVCELYKPLELETVNAVETGGCTLNHYFDTSYINEGVLLSNLNLDNLPNSKITSIFVMSDVVGDCGFTIKEYTVDILSELVTGSIESWVVYSGDAELYEEFFYISGTSTSIGAKFFKNTIFEIGTYYENLGMNTAWSITDELVVKIYSSNNVDSFYLCIGSKEDGTYYRWDFSLVSGWNNLKFNFYGSVVTKYVSNVATSGLLFKDLPIFNVWFGGIYLYNSGFVVLDTVSVDGSSVKNVLSSKEDAFYIPVYYESVSGSIQMDYITYYDSSGKILNDMFADKVLLSIFGDELSFSLVNKTSGKFVLGVYSYKQSTKIVKTFGKASGFKVNDKLKLKLNWYCNKGYFSSELYISGRLIGKIQFTYIELDKLKVTGVVIGGGAVYINSIYDSFSLCGQLNNIKIYSNIIESNLINDRLLVKVDGQYKNLVENSPIYLGKILPSEYMKVPVRYEGKSKSLSTLNLKIKWVGNY